MLALLPAAPKWQFFLPVERISKLFQLRIFSCISWWRIRTSCIYVQKLGRGNRKFSNWVSKWELMIQLIKRKIPEFFHPNANSLSIRCKCGEMSYCVPLLVTCFWTHFLAEKVCIMHHILLCLQREHQKPSIFWNLFLTPFFGNVRISMLSLWIMGSSIVKPDYETFTYIYRTEFSIINTRECSFSQKLWNCIEEGSKNENQKWNRPKVMVFQLCTYKAKWSRKLALHDQNQSLK